MNPSFPRISQDPADPAFQAGPYPFFERVRAAGPLVWWEEIAAPVAAGAAVVDACLRDRRLGREAPEELHRPLPPELADFAALEAQSLLEMDGPRHGRIRRLLAPAFTPSHIEALRPRLRRMAEKLVARLDPAGFDLVQGLAGPLPVRVICSLMGVPLSAADELVACSHAMVAVYRPGCDRATAIAANTAARRLTARLEDLVAARRAEPGDDLLSLLVTADDGGLRDDEILSTAALLLNAGHEATVHAIGNAVYEMLRAGGEERWRMPELLPAAADEALRIRPPLHLFFRWVKEDLELAGKALQRGMRVGLLLAGANRDPHAHDRPARFAADRPRGTRLTFGAGPHFCLGAPLARAEIEEAIRALLARFPRLAIVRAEVARSWHFHGFARLELRPTP